MKRTTIILCSAVFALSTMAQNSYDLNAPFGFCTLSSRTANIAYNITGGGCYTYPIPDNFTGKVVVLKSDGQDMKSTIKNAINNDDNKVIIFDGSDGAFYVSSNVAVNASNKTLLGINNARICTMWSVTDEIKAALDAAEVPKMSGGSGTGGTLPNGQYVSEEAEYNTRKIILQMTGDNSESYRYSGVLTLSGCQNIIIRNITFVGPGSVDVGGSDLLSSVNGANHIWVDHCAFIDGLDGNFDITQRSDFHTVSWCTFSYTNRSYMHQLTNLIGSSDSEATGYLNTTYAFNWWSQGCKARMPMARVGKIHMLNNYFSSTVASNCINPRKNSEFLIEGNYIEKGVKHYYGESDATAVTWKSDNYIAEASSMPKSKGSTVTVPYDYTIAPYSDVPASVKQYAGATLEFSNNPSPEPPIGTTGTITWPFDTGVAGQTAGVPSDITNGIVSTSVTLGSDLAYNGVQTSLGATKIQDRTVNFPSTTATASNAITFNINIADGYKFLATDMSVTASRIATDAGKIDISWTDVAGTTTIIKEGYPARENALPNSTTFTQSLRGTATETSGSCSLVINMYGVTTGYKRNSSGNQTTEVNYKDYAFKDIIVTGYLIDTTTGISTTVSFSPVVATEYYNISGQRVSSNTRGIIIERKHMSDGAVINRKIIK